MHKEFFYQLFCSVGKLVLENENNAVKTPTVADGKENQILLSHAVKMPDDDGWTQKPDA